MKLIPSLLLIAALAAPVLLTSCQTTKNDSEASGGISGQGMGYTREDVYQWQDRTLRQLAY